MTKNIVGEFIPNIYVDRITLETTGHVAQKTDNPHTAQGDNLYITKTSKYLKVTLNLTVKDTMSTTKINTGILPGVHQFLKIKVLQSSHALVTEAMLSLPNLASVFFDGQPEVPALQGSSPWQKVPIPPGATSLGIYPADVLYSVANGLTTVTPIDTHEASLLTAKAKKELYTDIYKLFVDIEEKNLDKVIPIDSDNFKTVMADGTTVYNIPYEIAFDNIPQSVQNLAYFATVTLDKEEFKTAFNLEDVDIKVATIPKGKIAAEVVIEDGVTGGRGTSYIFADPDGNIWGGPVSKLATGAYVTGFIPNKKSKTLTKTIIANNKIQDFRNFQSLQKLKLNLTVVDNALLSIKAKNFLSSDFLFDLNRGNKKSYFSAFYGARDTNNNINFHFFFNMLSFVKYNTLWGKLHNNMPSFVKDTIRVRSVKLLRRRIKRGVNWPNSSGTSYYHIPYDRDVPDHVVAMTSDTPNPPYKLKTKKSTRGSIQELFGTLWGAEKTDVRTFQGTDSTFKLLSDGEYQYGVEIDLEDTTAMHVKDFILGPLQATKHNLLKYLYKASDQHQGNKASKTGLNYSVELNRFTQKFIQEMKDKWMTGSNTWKESAPWIKAVNVYVTTLMIFLTQKEITAVSFEITKTLLMHTDPRSGTPRGIMNLVNLIDKLILDIESLVGLKSKKELSHGSTQGGNVHARSSLQRNLKIVHYFEETYDCNVPLGVGFNYLPPNAIPDEVGLYTIPEKDYKDICEAQYGDLNEQDYSSDAFVQQFLERSNNTYFLGLFRVDMGVNIPPLNIIRSPLFSLTPEQRSAQEGGTECDTESVQHRRVNQINKALMHVVKINQSKRSKFAGYIPTQSQGQSTLSAGLADMVSVPLPCPMHGANISGLTISNVGAMVSPSNSDAPHKTNTEILKGLKEYENVDKVEFDNLKDAEDRYDTADTARLSLDIFRRVYFPSKCNSSLSSFNNFLKEAAAEIRRVKRQNRPNTSLQSSGNRLTSSDERLVIQAMRAMPPQFVKLVVDQVFGQISTNKEESPEVGSTGLLDDPLFLGKMIFELGHIVRVMAMVGFTTSRNKEKTTGSIRWQILTPELLEGLPAGAMLFCKLVPYSYGEMMGASTLKAPMSTKLPIYNEYFMIRTSAHNKEAPMNKDVIPAIVAISNFVNNKIKKVLPLIVEMPEFSTNALSETRDPISVGGPIPPMFSRGTTTGTTGGTGGGMSGGGGGTY